MATSTAKEIRFCNDIGMFASDRPVSTCKWRTAFCRANCYNCKLYAMYKDMSSKDIRNEQEWQSLTGQALATSLNRKRKQTERFRLMTRGEALSTRDDIDRVKDICKANPERLVWLPTRAWRSKELRPIIEQELMPIKNLRLQASLDPSNSQQEIDDLVSAGWSTMFFGNDDKAPIEGSVKCPKTWEHKKGHCAKCKGGCFSPNQRHIWLKMH